MSEWTTISKVLMIIGGVLFLVGGAIWALSKVLPLGRLPGDIHIERPGFTCLIPIATSIVLSIVLSVALTILARLLNR